MSQRTDLYRTLTDFRNVINHFQVDPTRLNGVHNAGLDAANVEVTSILDTIAGFDTTPPTTYTVNAVMNVIARVKALRKSLKTARVTIAAGLQPYYSAEILGTTLDQAIDAADEFSSKAIGGVMNHTKNGVTRALKGTVKGIKKSAKPIAITV